VPRTLTKKDPLAILWVHTHRYVLYGQRRSADGKVERLLRERGAPVKTK
jgi:hypothetical protein